jgi:hypothetical protein
VIKVVCVIAAIAFSVPALAGQKVPADIAAESTSKLTAIGEGISHPAGVARSIQDIVDSFIPILSTNSNCYWRANGGAPATCDSAATIVDLAQKLSTVYPVVDYLTAEQKADVATGSPTLDLKTAIQNIENNVMPASGGTLYFGGGTYRWDSTILLSSHRRIECAPGAVFKPIYQFGLFANDKFATVDLTTDHTPATDANQTEDDFQIEGCKFDWTALTNAASPSPIWPYNNSPKAAYFVLAKNIDVRRNEFVASDPPKFNGSVYYGFGSAVACVGSSNCRFENNHGKGMHDVFDCWAGGKNCTYKNNWFELSDNETAHRGNGYCAGFNGRGTAADFHATLENIEISGNYCYSQGWRSCIQFDPLSAGSHVKKVKITDNICVAKSGTTNNTGIYARGQVEDVFLDGNTIENFNSLPIQIADSFSSGGPFTCTDCISTTNGSDIVTVAITTLTNTNVVVGNYLLFSGGTGAVGGITFASKYFLVTEVTSGVNVKVQADANASSSATGGGAVSVNVWWGAPDRVHISNTTLKNTSYASSALVYAVGTNVHISNTSATGGSYGAVTFASSFFRGTTNTPMPAVFGTTGAAGAGMAGTSGDNIDNYASTRNPRTPFPAIVLACGADPTTSALMDGEMWCNQSSNVIKARLGGANVQIGAAASPLSATKTVRDSAGTGTCTLIFTNGLLTGGTC